MVNNNKKPSPPKPDPDEDKKRREQMQRQIRFSIGYLIVGIIVLWLIRHSEVALGIKED